MLPLRRRRFRLRRLELLLDELLLLLEPLEDRSFEPDFIRFFFVFFFERFFDLFFERLLDFDFVWIAALLELLLLFDRALEGFRFARLGEDRLQEESLPLFDAASGPLTAFAMARDPACGEKERRDGAPAAAALMSCATTAAADPGGGGRSEKPAAAAQEAAPPRPGTAPSAEPLSMADMPCKPSRLIVDGSGEGMGMGGTP